MKPLLCTWILLTAGIALQPLNADDAVKETHDAVVPVPRSGNWMKRHEAMNARVMTDARFLKFREALS